MQSGVDFLNLEYILLRAYELISNFHFVADAPAWLPGLLTDIIVVGMAASLLMLVLAVYANIRLLQVEHAGFHALEGRAHEHIEPEVESTGKNERWERIVELANSGSQSDWRRAILEADIMLGDVLAQQGYSGATIGDQLKMANPIQMTTLDLAWKAHKVRNDIAHGGERYELSERDFRTTIDYFKRVFEELGAI